MIQSRDASTNKSNSYSSRARFSPVSTLFPMGAFVKVFCAQVKSEVTDAQPTDASHNSDNLAQSEYPSAL